MLDHMTFRVAEVVRTRAFHRAAPVPRSCALGFDAMHDVLHVLGDGPGGHVDACSVDGPWPHGGHPVTPGRPRVWRAPHRDAVDALRRVAQAAGGSDNGAPGPGPHHHPHYCVAFVIVPDGKGVGTTWHDPA